MEIIRKYKKLIMVALFLVFVVGIGSFMYFRNRDAESVDIEGFFNQKVEMEKDSIAVGKGEECDSGVGVKGIDGDSGGNSEGSFEMKENVEDEIYIHIIGEVRNEGIIVLKEGQRIVDAIEKAGGATELADLSRVNLAFVLSDGQKVRIPSVNDGKDEPSGVIDGSGNGFVAGSGNGVVGSNSGKKVNINSATQTELETLNGIGPSLATRIIEYRNKNGKFNSLEELMNVSGIGNSKLEGIRDSVVLK